MNWNLILAWLLYLCTLLIARIHERTPGRWVRLLPGGSAWLLFFPNAPYIMTDFVHLIRATGAPWWYDLGLIAAYAWAGCFLAVASLWAMHGLVRDYCGTIGGWLYALVSLGLGGVGIYLGRFARLNSWDIIHQPAHGRAPDTRCTDRAICTWCQRPFRGTTAYGLPVLHRQAHANDVHLNNCKCRQHLR